MKYSPEGADQENDDGDGKGETTNAELPESLESNEYRELIHRLIAGKKALMEIWGKRVGSALNAYDAEIRAAWDRGEEQGNMKAETKAKLAALMQSRDDAEEQYNRKETEFYRQVDRWLAEIIYKNQ